MRDYDLIDDLHTEIGLNLSVEQIAFLETLDADTAAIIGELIDSVYERGFDDAGRELCGGGK